MAVNLGCIWKKNVFGASGPLKILAQFQAGATQAVKQGEILDLATITAVVPLASDKSMAGIIGVADAEIRSGDLAGFHFIIVPRPGDVFELPLAANAAPALAAPLYFSTSQALATSGSNIIGYVVDQGLLPVQGFQSVNPSYDAGTTARTVAQVQFAFKQSVSYFAALFI